MLCARRECTSCSQYINAELEYLDKQNNTFKTQQITIVSIDTDEGVLEPLGVGEILIEVRY